MYPSQTPIAERLEFKRHRFLRVGREETVVEGLGDGETLLTAVVALVRRIWGIFGCWWMRRSREDETVVECPADWDYAL